MLTPRATVALTTLPPLRRQAHRSRHSGENVVKAQVSDDVTGSGSEAIESFKTNTDAYLEIRINELEEKLEFLQRSRRILSGAPDDLYDVEEGEWCEVLDDMTSSCEEESFGDFKAALQSRATWLVGLLAAQSMSSFVLVENEALITSHPSVVFFMTMLVGAGGNAGNQAAVRVIRGLATGTVSEKSRWQFLRREVKMGAAIATILTVVGFVRVAVFKTAFDDTVAVTASLFIITFISVALGAALPLLLDKINVDPAHASTTIQVVMDIMGVLIVCAMSAFVMPLMAAGSF